MTHIVSLSGRSVVMAMPAAGPTFGRHSLARITAGKARCRTSGHREPLLAHRRAAVPADLRKQHAGASDASEQAAGMRHAEARRINLR